MQKETDRFSPEVEAAIDRRFNTMVDLIYDAGVEALRIQQGGSFSEVQKEAGAGDIVTAGDMAVQKILLEELAGQFPDDKFDSEELPKNDASAPRRPFKWVLDPIDGTVAYRNNMEEWGISAGIHYQGQAVAGVILFPRRNTLLTARIGQGAFRDKKPIHTSNRALRDGIISFSYGYLRNPEDPNYNQQEQEEKIDLLISGFFKAFGGRVQTVHIGVCVTWMICQIAASEGSLACLHTYVTPYDLGAAKIIVEEAGGVVSLFDYDKARQGVLVAANQAVYAEVVDRLGQDLRRRANLPF